jgi:hypothetical protein
MTKASPRQTSDRNARNGDGKVLGVTRDGVRILKPGRATHFTAKEAREAVASVLAAKR